MRMGAYNNQDMTAPRLQMSWGAAARYPLMKDMENYVGSVEDAFASGFDFTRCNGFFAEHIVVGANVISVFGFDVPTEVVGQITNVAIWCYVRGKARTALGLKGFRESPATPGQFNDQSQIFSYGPSTSDNFVFSWIHSDFPIQDSSLLPTITTHYPRPWTWNDILNQSGGRIIGGAYLSDQAMIKSCKLVVDSVDSNGIVHQITLWPNIDIIGGHVGDTGTAGGIPWWGTERFDPVVALENSLQRIGYIDDTFNTNTWMFYSLSGGVPGKLTFPVQNYPAINATDIEVRIKYTGAALYGIIIIAGVEYQATPISSGLAVWDRDPRTNLPWTGTTVRDIQRYGVISDAGTYLGPGAWSGTGNVSLDIYSAQGTIHSERGVIQSAGVNFFYRDALYNSLFLANLGSSGARHASNFSEIPPNGSLINSIKVTYAFYGWDWANNGQIRPFLYYGGVYHYGTLQTFNADPFTRRQYDYTWSGLTYNEAQGAQFGIEIVNGNCYIIDLYADIAYQEILETVEYSKLAVEEEGTIFAQYTQNPIKPDDLWLTLKVGDMLPERSEIVYVQKGAHVFQGPVWTAKEKENHEVEVHAKAQQIYLFFRNIPNFFYYARNQWWNAVITIEKLFGNNTPTYPFYQCGGTKNISPLYGEWGPIYAQRAEYTALHDINLGIFFLINSCLPQGRGELGGKVAGFGRLAVGRAMFSTNHDPTLSGANDFIGGVHRLCLAASKVCGNGEYFVDGDDLYVTPYPDSMMILADGAVDTFLRPGENDLKDLLLNVPYTFKGAANSSFDEVFELMGQELQFRPNHDATVRMNAGLELARGSATEPLRKFEHGVNCLVAKKPSTEPTPTAIIGKGEIPQVSTDWKQARQPTIKVLADATFGSEDMRAYLSLQREEDETLYTIDYNEEDPLLRVGDYIWVKPKNEGYKAVRIRQNIVSHGHTQLSAGKRLFSISKRFGQWRNAVGTSPPISAASSQALGPDVRVDNKRAGYGEHKIRRQIIDLDGVGGTQNFTVDAADLADDDWRCKLNLSIGETKKATAVETILSVGGATIAASGPYTGQGDNTYEVLIVSNGNMGWYTPYQGTPFFGNPSWCWRKNGGAWSAATPLLIGGHWYQYTRDAVIISDSTLIADGISFQVSWNPGHPNGITPQIGDPTIVGSNWRIIAIDESGTRTYSQLAKILRLKLNGRIIPPGRHLFVGNSETLDLDISDYVVVGTNSLQVTLQNGLTRAASPNWYHTLTGSIDQCKRVKVVINA
jgi:hypothetical protein